MAEDDENLMKLLPEDILDQVFKYLPIRSLSKSAQVCKLWYEISQREMARRSLYSVVLRSNPYMLKHIIHEFKVKPKKSLYFCASRPHLRTADNVEYATLYQYNAKFPMMGETVVLGVEHSMFNTKEIRSCQEQDRQTRQYFPQNGVLGIILPDTKDLNLKIAWCECNEESSEADASRIFEQLQPNEHEGKSVYLMFGMNGYSVASRVITMLRQKYKKSQPNIWGGTIASFIKSNSSYPTDEDLRTYENLPHPKYLILYGFIGILIQRPRLSVFSTIIYLKDDLVAKLTQFKAKVTLRGRSLGMVCGPHSQDKVIIYKEIMEAIKHQFATVTFVGYFNGDQLHYYGCDNTSTDENQSLIHQNAISIMILTYD